MNSHEMWFQTFSRRQFSCVAPKPEVINILDIAHALSHQCRFNGHVRQFYSVAQHCVHVADLVVLEGEPEWALEALLHDAHEAYVGDVVRPLKPCFEPWLSRMCKDIDAAIALRFHLKPQPWPACIDEFDKAICANEVRDLMPDGPTDDMAQRLPEPVAGVAIHNVWCPHDAKRQFLERFAEWHR